MPSVGNDLEPCAFKGGANRLIWRYISLDCLLTPIVGTVTICRKAVPSLKSSLQTLEFCIGLPRGQVKHCYETAHKPPETTYGAYFHLDATKGFSVYFTHAGIEPLLWSQTDTKEHRRGFRFSRLFHIADWHIAFGLAALRIAISVTKRFCMLGFVNIHGRLEPGHDIAVEDAFIILLFCTSILLVNPFFFVVSSIADSDRQFPLANNSLTYDDRAVLGRRETGPLLLPELLTASHEWL